MLTNGKKWSLLWISMEILPFFRIMTVVFIYIMVAQIAYLSKESK